MLQTYTKKTTQKSFSGYFIKSQGRLNTILITFATTINNPFTVCPKKKFYPS